MRDLDDLLASRPRRRLPGANNRSEADHARLKARLRPLRGLKQVRSASRIAAGHAFVQNLRRGHYELATEAAPPLRLASAFTELAQAM
jgi:transposase-like protein